MSMIVRYGCANRCGNTTDFYRRRCEWTAYAYDPRTGEFDRELANTLETGESEPPRCAKCHSIAVEAPEPIRWATTIVRYRREFLVREIHAFSAEEALSIAKAAVWNFAADRIDPERWEPSNESESFDFEAEPLD